MNNNPLKRVAKPAAAATTAIAPPITSHNAFGVPTITPRVRAQAPRPAGDAIDDLMNTLAAHPGQPLSPADVARISAEGGSTPPLPPAPADQLSDAQRAQVEQTNRALISAGAQAIGLIGTTISTAIQSGNQVQIAQIEAQSRQAVARLLLQAQQAQSAGNLAAAQLAQQQATQAAGLNQLMLALQGRQGPSTTTMLLIGGGVLAAALLLPRLMGPRRNPGIKFANPVMVRGRGSRSQRKYFRAGSQERRARAHGWRKAR